MYGHIGQGLNLELPMKKEGLLWIIPNIVINKLRVNKAKKKKLKADFRVSCCGPDFTGRKEKSGPVTTIDKCYFKQDFGTHVVH